MKGANEKLTASHDENRNKFYRTMAGILLLTVLVGFSTKFFLRPLFDVPPIPSRYLYLHGVIMTGWYLLFLVQTSLVLTGRTPLHRKLGVFGAFLGAAVFFSAIVVILNAFAWGGDRGIDFVLVSPLVWLNIGITTAFGSLFFAAIVNRKRTEVHKRLMLLASISMIGPATSRIGLWPIFEMPIVFSIGGTLIFLAAIAFHELLVSRRVNVVTVVGGLYVVVVALLIPYLISRTEFGVEFVRSLA